LWWQGVQPDLIRQFGLEKLDDKHFFPHTVGKKKSSLVVKGGIVLKKIT
jgi:hypothetical protein